MSSTGCSMMSNAYKQATRTECLDEFMLAHRNRAFALKAWYRERDCFRNKPHQNELKAGFIAGYMEIAEGGDGCSPCTAPSQYWGWRYQSPDGRSAIDAWFAGYPLGVKAAEMDGVGYWGNTHQGSTATPAKPASTESAELPEPVEPIEPPTPIYGPDGRLLPPGQELKEYIIPGTERVVPPSELDAMRFQGGEGLLEPTPTTVGLNGASGMAEEPQSELVIKAASTDQPFQAVADLVPSSKAVETPQTFSLDDLGDDAIEDLFGSVEMLGPVKTTDSVSSTAGTEASPIVDPLPGLLPPAAPPAAKTADADQGIPFKFE
ncbi:MAG: hypothetical protein AAGJ83_00915 [Planctomycetota bacterium]